MEGVIHKRPLKKCENGLKMHKKTREMRVWEWNEEMKNENKNISKWKLYTDVWQKKSEKGLKMHKKKKKTYL